MFKIVTWYREYKRWKYYYTIDLLFDWFGLSCVKTDNFCFNLQNRLIQTSQTGGQWYSDTSPFSIPLYGHCHYNCKLRLSNTHSTGHWVFALKKSIEYEYFFIQPIKYFWKSIQNKLKMVKKTQDESASFCIAAVLPTVNIIYVLCAYFTPRQ